MNQPDWLAEHRAGRDYYQDDTDEGGAPWDVAPIFHRAFKQGPKPGFLRDKAFNRHSTNDGTHVSPYDEGRVLVGVDDLEVRLIQGINEYQLKQVLARTLRATTGISPDETIIQGEWEEMMRGGLQSALESQVVIFEVHGASRALTHQLVRTRKAAFHQQSQRATWMGDKPNVRWPESILNPDEDRDMDQAAAVLAAWHEAQKAAWNAYKVACDAGISYQDARFILPEGTTGYIVCEYPLREFLNVYAYRACSMFMWEMVACVRKMGVLLAEAHPFLEPYIKISCEKGPLCNLCKGSGFVWDDGVAADETEVKKFQDLSEDAQRGLGGTGQIMECWQCGGKGSNERRCTFQGWENVEGQCDFAWAKQSNRTFLPNPKFRIGER